MSLAGFVRERFEEFKCYGHCDQPATLRFVREGEDGGMLVAATVCHAGYVSRIIAFGRDLQLEIFRFLILDALDGRQPFNNEDIRTATRFEWEIQDKGDSEGKVLREAYWTQNYRTSKIDDPNRAGLFVCANCGSFYLQPVTKKEILCDGCVSGSDSALGTPSGRDL